MIDTRSRWVLRISTALVGVWCAASITVYRPAIERALPGEAFVAIPSVWAGLVVVAFVVRGARSGLPAGTAGSILPLGLFALATIPTSLLQTEDLDPDRVTRIVFVSLQIFCLAVALPVLFRRRDFEWTLAILAAAFLLASLFVWAVNLLHVSHALGEDLPRMNERGGPLRYGIVFHRNPNSFIFQWMPAVLLSLGLRACGGWRVAAGAAAALVFAQMMASFSRGTTLTVLLSLTPLAYHGFRRFPLPFLGGLAIAAGALAAVAGSSSAVREYLGLGLDLMNREWLWRAHLEQLRASGSKLWGVGYFNSWVQGWWGPHNAFVAVLAYYGVAGLLGYAWILVREGRAGWRASLRAGRPLEVQLLLALLAATLAWGLVEDGLSGPLTVPAFGFWLLVGMTKALGPEGERD